MEKDKDVILTLGEMAYEYLKIFGQLSKTADELEKKETILEEKRRQLSSKKIDIQIKPFNLTAKDFILKIFEDSVPRTARQLINEFNIISGRKLDYNALSCRLRYLKKKNVIRSQNFMLHGSETRFIYGLTDWFEKGQLKQEFLDNFKY